MIDDEAFGVPETAFLHVEYLLRDLRLPNVVHSNLHLYPRHYSKPLTLPVQTIQDDPVAPRARARARAPCMLI